MEKPSDKILLNGVVHKVLLNGEEEEESGDAFNEVELTQADVAAQSDKTVVVRMHSVDISTPELLKLAKETYKEMRESR